MPSGPDPIAEFRATAERYIDLIESACTHVPKKTRPKARRDDLLANLADALSMLYNRALHLPDAWDDAWAFEGERELTEEESDRRALIFRQLSRKFEGIDYYSTVVAFGKDALEQHGGLLSDDLGDIYWDIQEGFDLLKAGRSEGEAGYTWRWGFWNHWSEHAVNALRIIHARLPEASTFIGSEE